MTTAPTSATSSVIAAMRRIAAHGVSELRKKAAHRGAFSSGRTCCGMWMLRTEVMKPAWRRAGSVASAIAPGELRRALGVCVSARERERGDERRARAQRSDQECVDESALRAELAAK